MKTKRCHHIMPPDDSRAVAEPQETGDSSLSNTVAHNDMVRNRAFYVLNKDQEKLMGILIP